mgnify:CR=1 FL=1
MISKRVAVKYYYGWFLNQYLTTLSFLVGALLNLFIHVYGGKYEIMALVRFNSVDMILIFVAKSLLKA